MICLLGLCPHRPFFCCPGVLSVRTQTEETIMTLPLNYETENFPPILAHGAGWCSDLDCH